MTTDLLERAIRVAQALSPEMQDDLARMVLMYAGEEAAAFALTADDAAAINRSRAQALRGEFASDEQIRGIWAKHGL